MALFVMAGVYCISKYFQVLPSFSLHSAQATVELIFGVSVLSVGSLSYFLYVAAQLRLSLHPLWDAGRSWAGYCWDSPPSRCTVRVTYALRGLAQDCLRESSPEFTQFNGGRLFTAVSY